jgi:hypothetical protein
VSGPKTNSIAFKKNTNTLVFTFSGLSMEVDLIDVGLRILLAHLDVTHISVKNFTIYAEAFTTTTDGVHWQIGGMTNFHVDDVYITFK